MKLTIKISKDVDGYFRAWCPSLPGCFAYGPTREEAKTRLDVAIRGYLASLNAIVPGEFEHNILSA